jgi:hypothetical protein
MKTIEIISEGASSVLYHYTSLNSAVAIFESGQFLLSSSTGNKSEELYAVRGYPYFLSTARNKTADFAMRPYGGAVMFNLDGRWLGARYPVKPVDYWDRAWLNDPTRGSEQEDRVLSKTPAIPLDSVTAVHVLIPSGASSEVSKSAAARSILLAAKKRGINVYAYTDESAWKLQDTRRAVPLSQAPIRGNKPANVPYTPDLSYYKDALNSTTSKDRYREYTNYKTQRGLKAWLDLIIMTDRSRLSQAAKNLLTKLNRAYSPSDDSGLGNDLANARKPNNNQEYDQAARINAFMQKNKLSNTTMLAQWITNKWNPVDNQPK